MDIFIYDYARPIYVELMLNSLCYNISNRHNIHLVFNKSNKNKEEEQAVKRVMEKYPNHIESVYFLDDNYLGAALNIPFNRIKQNKKKYLIL